LITQSLVPVPFPFARLNALQPAINIPTLLDSPLIGREKLQVSLVLHLIQPPLAFVVVAGDWPGGLRLLKWQ
jgi:hypothetical protein